MFSAAPAESGFAHKLETMVESLIEDHRDTVVNHLREVGGREALEAANNDAAMTALAQRFYGLLPGMVRMVVSEDAVVGFVLRNRMAVLAKVTPLFGEAETVPQN